MSVEFRPMRSVIYVDVCREEYRHRLQHWLYGHHIQDSISNFGPYVTKYAFYNALPVPPEGERFGTRRMQMTEHYWLVNEMEPEMRNKAIAEYMPMDVLRWQGCVPDTDETPHENLDGDVGRSIGGDNGCPPFVFAHVPISWEEDFKGKGRMVCDGPNYRWQFVIQYPDGVSEEEGERWFHEEIVPYFQARPEVNRFLSSRIYHDVVGCTFHRLVELWFDGPEEWYQAAVEGAKALPSRLGAAGALPLPEIQLQHCGHVPHRHPHQRQPDPVPRLHHHALSAFRPGRSDAPASRRGAGNTKGWRDSPCSARINSVLSSIPFSRLCSPSSCPFTSTAATCSGRRASSSGGRWFSSSPRTSSPASPWPSPSAPTSTSRPWATASPAVRGQK